MVINNRNLQTLLLTLGVIVGILMVAAQPGLQIALAQDSTATPVNTVDRIVFSATLPDGTAEIYAVGLDGKDPIRLTYNTTNDLAPVWSPDGKQIAYISRAQGGQYGLFVMDSDGSNPRQLHPNLTSAQSAPAWSPDGRQILIE